MPGQSCEFCPKPASMRVWSGRPGHVREVLMCDDCADDKPTCQRAQEWVGSNFWIDEVLSDAS